ncbi:MAG: ABC transporter permease [Chloroflexi bacterium]|nr:ABC transporter permease [Chloroflexota bacterium]
MNFEIILAAGVASGTILLFAAIGEIFTERSGIINLGVEGMMFVGALVGFKIGLDTGNPWLGLALAMAAGALLALLHAIVCIHFQADQIVSGLALTFLGTGIALVLGEGLAGTGTSALLPTLTIPLLSSIPFIGPVFFTDQSILVYVGYLLVPIAYVWIDHTRPGLHLRAVGEQPSAADALGVDVYRTRYAYTLFGGALAGLAGATISMAITPGWFANQTTSGLGWIAVGLVIFAQWSPGRAMIGAYLIAVIRRLTLDLQAPSDFFGIPNPFFTYQPSTFFLNMLPYALVILVLVIGSREARRRRIGAPASLGVPYVRGERGH